MLMKSTLHGYLTKPLLNSEMDFSSLDLSEQNPQLIYMLWVSECNHSQPPPSQELSILSNEYSFHYYTLILRFPKSSAGRKMKPLQQLILDRTLLGICFVVGDAGENFVWRSGNSVKFGDE
ncbi:hypothetical protein Syun_021713 [Stephania yunnanensis]|uniref:Uncharacterized protein n=1 Tax=Stephania yunnanensis TaxID=152371 RepID=A0AAP0IHK3_9MAGN